MHPSTEPTRSLPSPAENLWERAFTLIGDQKLRATLKAAARTQKRDILTAVLQTIRDIELDCIRKRLRFKDGNGHEIITRDLLQKIACSAMQFKEGHIELQFEPINACFPWAAIRFLLRTPIKDAHEYGLVVSELEQITRLMTKYYQVEHQHLEHGPPTRDVLAMPLTRLYADILLHLGRMIYYYRQNTHDTMADKTFCPGHNSEGIKELMEQARNIANLAHIEGADAPRFMDPTVTRSSHESLACWQTLTKENQQRLSSWLSPLPLCQSTRDVSASGAPRPADWLLENPQLRLWHVSSSSCVLLLQGPAGCGKTAMCSAVVKNLSEAEKKVTCPAPFAYVCCAEIASEQGGSSSDAVMRTIVAQLLTHRSDNTKDRELLWADFERRSALARVKGLDLARLGSHACAQLILELAENDALTIVISAIDRVKETERRTLINALKGIATNSGNVAKILVSSSDDGEVFSALARDQRLSRDPSSTLAEDRASLHAMCFTACTETRVDDKVSLLEGSDAAQGKGPIAPEETHLRPQSETWFQTMAGYELAVLEATQAGSITGLERLEHSSFWSRLFLDEAKEKLHSMTRQAIQGGHISVLAWYLKTSSDPSEVLPDDAVATAVLYSDLAMIRYLLEKGMSIETEGRFGSPLVTACLLNRRAIAQVLVQLGADVNAKGTFGGPLDIAALKGHKSIVKMLIDAGANVNQSGGPYGTVLQAAAFHGHLDTVKLLLDAGAKDFAKGYSMDAFHAAIEGGHADIVLHFLKRGYDRRPWTDNFTCHGVEYPGLDNRRDLLRDASPGRADRERREYGQVIDQDEAPEAVKPLTDLQAIFEADQHPWARGHTSVAEPNGHGKLRFFKYTNLLDSAARTGRRNMVELILSQLDALDLDSGTVKAAAVVAAREGHFSVLDALLQHLAIRIPITEYLQSIVDAGREAKPPDTCEMEDIFDIVGRYCSPADMDKLRAKTLTMAQKYEAGDDLDYETMVEDLSSACTYGELDNLAAIVRSNNGRRLKPGLLTEGLQQCAMSGYAALFRFLFEFLLNSGSFKDIADATDDSLIGAAANGHLDVVKLLVSLLEAKPFSTKTIGRALVNACEGRHEQVVEYLVQQVSADVNGLALDRAIEPPLESPRYWFSSPTRPEPSPSESCLPAISPLQAAIRGFRADKDDESVMDERKLGSEPNSIQIIKVLLDSGARPNDLGAQQMYPIQAAAGICPDPVVEQLIEAGADVNLAVGEDTSIFRAAGRESSSGTMLGMLIDAGANLPSEEGAIIRLFEKPLSYFDGEKSQGMRSLRSHDGGFRRYQSMQDVFGKGPGAAIHTLLTLYPNMRVSDKRYEHVLQMAAFSNHHALASMLLSRGVDVNAPGHYYGTALQAAARCGHQDMVLQLLQTGAEVNVLQGKWQTALRAAIVGGHECIVRTLLDNGADLRLALKVNESNRKGTVSSCLQLAVATGKVGIVSAFLEAGAVASEDDSDKFAGVRVGVDQPPLIMSAEQGNMAITRALLDSGADVNVAGRKIWNHYSFSDEYASPLSAAVAGKHWDVINLLLEHGADVNQTVDDCRSALILAVNLKDQSLVRLLLKAGADVHDLIWCGTALTAAAEHDHLGIVQDLLAAGAKVDIGKGSWINPVKHALEMPRWEPKDFRIAEILLEALMETQDPGPLVEALSEAIEKRNSKAVGLILGHLPVTASRFHQACAAGSEPAVRHMLERGISPNDAGDDGDYPLHVAASHLQPAIIEILLEHGADLNVINRDGETPLQNALEASAAPRLDFLDPEPARKIPAAISHAQMRHSTKWSPGSQSGPPKIEYSMFNRCEEIAGTLLDKGARLAPVAGNVAGPPLHVACLIGSKRTVVQLLEKGADVNEIGGHFKHVLFIALVTGRPDLVTYLLEHGADPNYLHQDYGTPLHLASKMNAKLSVKQLLDHGADAAELDANGKLPLEFALKLAQDERRNYTRYGWGSEDYLQSLLKSAGGEVQVTEAVLLDAAQTQGSHRLFELLERDKGIVISEQIAIAAMTSDDGFGGEKSHMRIDRLMKRTGNLGVTENMLRSVRGYQDVKKLTEHRPLCKITPELLCSLGDARSVKLLLEANHELPVTESLVLHALRLGGESHTDDAVVIRDENTLLEMLWERNHDLVATADMVAAARSETDLQFILEHVKGSSISISEEAVSKVLECESRRRLPMMKLLLQHDPSVRFSPAQALRMVGYPSYAQGLDMMLSHDPTMPIDEDIFLEFFGVMKGDAQRVEFVDVLKRHGRKLVFTKKMRDAVDETYQYQNEMGKREMMYSVREDAVE